MERKNKIVMLGDSGVGKTCLVNRWTKGACQEDQAATVGAAYSCKNFTYDGTVHKIQIWDTAGQEKYRAMAPVYTQGSFGAFLVFDIHDHASFEHIPEWIECADCDGQIAMVLLGNKSDIEGNRDVTPNEAFDFAEQHNMTYFEVSAMNGAGVEAAFSELLKLAFERRMHTVSQEQPVDLNPKASTDNNCC